jgi:hypothetical protein
MHGEDRQSMQADQTLSPVDLPDDASDEGHALRWASIAIATAAAVLLLGNARTIDEWANDLPPGAAAARLTAATGAWAAIAERSGLSAPRAAVHAAWKRGEALTFPVGPGAAGRAPDTSPSSR